MLRPNYNARSVRMEEQCCGFAAFPLYSRHLRSARCRRRMRRSGPRRPVKIVVAFAPGGSADQFGRLLAAELSAAFKQQFFVENRPGNSGAIGSAQVARAEPDGYTLLIGGSGPHLTGPAINPNIGYDPLRDFTHIAMIGADSYAWVAHPALGAISIAMLVALAASRHENGKAPITSSSPGPGSLGHLLLEAVQAQGRDRYPARARAQFRT